MEQTSTRFELRLPGDLLDALNAAARVRRVSASEAVREAIRAFVAATENAVTTEAAPTAGERPQSTSMDPATADRRTYEPV